MGKVVFVCSPYRGDVARNVAHAIACCETEMALGNTPYAPHLFFPQITEDDDTGIDHGLEMLQRCDELHQWSREATQGMKIEIEYADSIGLPVVQMV